MLGRMFRKYFVDTVGFMPANLTLSSFYVHSDDVPRVVASAEVWTNSSFDVRTDAR